jgi:hypothetical protein
LLPHELELQPPHGRQTLRAIELCERVEARLDR